MVMKPRSTYVSLVSMFLFFQNDTVFSTFIFEIKDKGHGRSGAVRARGRRVKILVVKV